MINPSQASKMPLSSRFGLLAALTLCGIFGISTAIFLPEIKFQKESNRTILSEDPQSIASSSAPHYSDADIPKIAASDLIEFCAQNITPQRTFVVFQHGTCVIVNEPSADPLAEAQAKLKECARGDVRFISEMTSEGNLIVGFTQPIFQRFNREQIVDIAPWLNSKARALMTSEERMKAGDGWEPGQQAKFGLLARRRMLDDSVDLTAVKIVRSSLRAVASN